MSADHGTHVAGIIVAQPPADEALMEYVHIAGCFQLK